MFTSTNEWNYGGLFDSAYGTCGHYCCGYGFDLSNYSDGIYQSEHPIFEGQDDYLEIYEWHMMHLEDEESDVLFSTNNY